MIFFLVEKKFRLRPGLENESSLHGRFPFQIYHISVFPITFAIIRLE